MEDVVRPGKRTSMELWRSMFPVSSSNMQNIVTGNEVTGLLSWWRPVHALLYQFRNAAHLRRGDTYISCVHSAVVSTV